MQNLYHAAGFFGRADDCIRRTLASRERMLLKGKVNLILAELKTHAPFTLFGALAGIVCMLIFRQLPHRTAQTVFYLFHPAHVVLSAMVTASMFSFYAGRARFLLVLVVGYVGSIGIATASDSLIPYVGELLLGMHAHTHVGFIEGWYIVNPAAVLGVLIAHFWPKTKFPHAGHVLVSTWASSLHMIMAMGGVASLGRLAGSFVFLFLAVWLPCCTSDIIFPLLFAKSPSESVRVHY